MCEIHVDFFLKMCIIKNAFVEGLKIEMDPELNSLKGTL